MSSFPVREPGGLASDGRDLDPRLADAAGLAAGQRPQDSPDRPMPGFGAPVWHRRAGAWDAATYYGQPVVKAPPWGGRVSAYVVAGGVAGTSAAIGGAAVTLGGPGLRPLAGVALPLAAASGALGAGLLMSDLGRPARFLHMMRVVRPTSVMNVGGYLLSATTGAAFVATLLAGRDGVLGSGGRAAAAAAALTGIPLSGYTGVLLSATAIPGWNVGAATLPPLFMSSGAATAGCLLRLAPLPAQARLSVDVVTVAAQAAELAAGAAHDRRLRDRPRIKACYDRAPGWRLGRWATAGSLLLGLLPTRRTRAGQVAAAVLGAAGSTLTKTAVFDAGIASAADPLAVPESS